MTAKEARQLAIEACKEDLELVKAKIKEAAIKGKTELGIGGQKGGVIAYLEDEGYEFGGTVYIDGLGEIESCTVKWKIKPSINKEEIKEVERVLNIAQCEIRAMYDRLNILSSNALIEINQLHDKYLKLIHRK